MVFGSTNKLKKLPQFDVVYEGSSVKSVVSYKYLGLTLDKQLNYGLHVSRIVSSVASSLTVKAAILVYESMLLPILKYSDCIIIDSLCN